MSVVVKAENLGKKYIIGHQKQDSYLTLRDSLTHAGREIWQSICHPFSPNREKTDVEEFWALRDIHLEIKEGDRVGIIGKNGAGKSTLLKILSRITEPTTGRVSIKGRVASLLEVGTGFHPELTGRENIFLNGAILGMSGHEIKRKFDEIVAFAEVEKFLDTPVKRYSSGMYVRLAFAVAAHLEPEILLVDEVLAVGDAQFQKKCLGKMGEVSKEGRTVLFVSHNMSALQKLCETSLLLDGGCFCQIGETAKIVEKYLGGKKKKETEYFFRHDASKSEKGYVKKLTIEDQQGEPLNEIPIGSPWRIRIDFTIERTIRDFVIGVGCIKDPDIAVRTVWSSPCDIIPGDYTVYFSENILYFSTGCLRLVIGLSSRGLTFQYLDDNIYVNFSDKSVLNDSRILKTDNGIFCNPMNVRIETANF